MPLEQLNLSYDGQHGKINLPCNQPKVEVVRDAELLHTLRQQKPPLSTDLVWFAGSGYVGRQAAQHCGDKPQWGVRTV